MIEVVLDTETTGLSVREGHRIVEIGCVELDNLVPTQKKFHSYLNPERKVSEKALEVHGYTDDFLSNQPWPHAPYGPQNNHHKQRHYPGNSKTQLLCHRPNAC